jgi:CheY-like chemotaxis protein
MMMATTNYIPWLSVKKPTKPHGVWWLTNLSLFCLFVMTENQLNIDDDNSPRGSEDQFLAAIEQPPSPYSDDGLDVIDMFGDPGSLVSEEESTSVCSQDWCKSEQSSQTLVGSGSGLGPSSLTRARVMVVDPVLRSRKSLKLMLERCGFNVSCALSGSEALWRFEQSLQDPEGYSVIFVNLSVARHEDYNFVHEIRAMEQDANLSSPSLIVAVTDLDRCIS